MKLFRPIDRTLVRTLATERFVLKPMGFIETLRLTNAWRTDAEILLAIYQSANPRSLRKWMRSQLMPNNLDRFAFAIIPKATGRPIGAEIVNVAGYRSAFLTVALHDRDWRGKGVLLETRSKLINHFFRNGGIERVYGTVESRNMASIYNYRRLGFDHVGTWHRHKQDPVSGSVFDMVHFELFRDKWDRSRWAEQAE